VNPYKINEPAILSLSFGRSSAYMLWETLMANDGIPEDCLVIFSNTGKELNETLDFGHAIETNWGVDVLWLEFDGLKKEPKIVDYDTASRNGEPFDLLISEKMYLPNPMARFCTSELKIVPMEKYAKSIGMDSFLTVIGIRADEPRRAAKQKIKEDYAVPMSDAGATIETVRDFWDKQNFGLNLPMMPNGVSNLSNCDLCFLKGLGIKLSILESLSPDRADWWISQEKKIGARFRREHIDYARMKVIAADQGQLFNFGEDESMSCFCGD